MKLFEDNVYNLLGMAEHYILKNIRWRSEIIGTERTEIPEIPAAVIRELNKSIEQFGSGFKRINSLCKDAGFFAR